MTSKTKILQALEEILLTQGAGVVTVRLVCQAAGVNHGLVPHYFGNKEGLLKAGLRFIADRKIRTLLEAVKDCDRAMMVETFTKALTRDRKFAKMLLEFHVLAGQSKALAETLSEIVSSRTRLLMTAFCLDRPTALFFQSSIIGIQLMRSACGQEYVEMAAKELAEQMAEKSQISPESVQRTIKFIEEVASQETPSVGKNINPLSGVNS